MRAACAFILCSYYIPSSSNFAMLHNANLNIVNLNTLTLWLPMYNRMTSPMPHQMYPLLEVEYDDEVSKRHPRDSYTPMTQLVMLNLCRMNIVVRNLQTHEPMKMLCGNLSTCAWSWQHLQLFTTPTAAPVQLQLRLVSFCLCPGTAASWAMARQNLDTDKTWAQGWRVDFVHFRNSQLIRYY